MEEISQSFQPSFYLFLFTKEGDLDYPPLNIQIQSRMKKYLPHISLFTPSNDKNILLNRPQLNTTLPLFKKMDNASLPQHAAVFVS